MRPGGYNHNSGRTRLLISLVVGLIMTFVSIVLFYPYGDFRMAGAPFRFLTMSERVTSSSIVDNIRVNWKLLLFNWVFFASLIWAILLVFSLASTSMKRNILLALTAGIILSAFTVAVYQPAQTTKYRQQALEVRGIPFPFLLVGGEYSSTKKGFLYRYSTDLLALSADVVIWSCVAGVSFALKTQHRRAECVASAGGRRK